MTNKSGRNPKAGSTRQSEKSNLKAEHRKSESRDEIPNAIWTSTLDGRYAVTVTRLDKYHGELTVRDQERLIHRQAVGLAFGAIFGPDVDDVATWQQIAIEIVDGQQPSDKRSETKAG